MRHGTLDGYNNHRCRCDECCAESRRYHREYGRRARAERRAAWFEGKCCATCGATERLVPHHRDPATKGKDFFTVWTWSEVRREAELAKCDILCDTCHRRLHAIERWGAPLVHGTNAAYAGRGCRCDECRRAHRDNARAYRTKSVG